MQSQKKSVDLDSYLNNKVLSLMPGLVAVYNVRSGQYIYVNDALEQVLGYSKEAFLTQGFAFVSSLVHPEDLPRLLKENSDAINLANSKNFVQQKNNPLVTFEYRMKHRDGSYHWLHTTGTIFERSVDGKVEQVLNISVDITKRKEQELWEVQKRKSLFMQAPAAIVILRGPHSIIELANPIALRIWGKSEAVLNKPLLEALPEIQGQEIEEHIKRVYESGESYTGLSVKVPFDRQGNGKIEEAYLNFVYTPLRNAFHVIEGVMAFGYEVTDQVKAQQVLQESEQSLKRSQDKLSFLIEASTFLASSLDYEDILKHIAKISVPYFADFCVFDVLTKENKVERVTWEHVDKKLTPYLKIVEKFTPKIDYINNPVAYSLKMGKSSLIPIVTDAWMQKAATNPEHLTFQRTLGYTSVITVPLRIRNKIGGSLTFIYTKASNRHYSESDLRIAEELSNRAALAISNARLFSEIQKAVTLRDDFISVASHELKTPVTSLKIYTQVMQKKFAKNGDDEFTRPLIKMNEQINKLTVLINDLLNVSKLQHGKLEFTMEEIDLNVVVKETVEAVQETEKKHSIHITGTITRKVCTDKYRIYQVITNLLTNAIKYSPNANTIMVHLAHDKNAAVVSVEDFGIGIDKEHTNKIFDQFYRVTTSEEKTYPGLGLGLYIANEIIKRHGGKMSVVSSKGKGSQFSFTVPYVQEKAQSL